MMPQYIYKARDNSQKLIEGTIEADNLDQAIGKIVSARLFPFTVEELKRASVFCHSEAEGRRISTMFRFFASLRMTNRKFRKVPRRQVMTFTQQLSDLTASGVSLAVALHIASHQTQHHRFKSIIEEICIFIEDGGSFADSLSRHPQAFSDIYVNLVKSGEMSGKLSEILNRLADLTQKEFETHTQMMAGLVYPLFIFVVGAGTIFILLTFVIPQLTVIFDEANESLPLITRILIAISDFFSRFWWLILGLMVLIVQSIMKFQNSLEGKLRMDTLRLRIPIAGNFIRHIEWGRFLRTLSALLESGIALDQALRSAQAVLSNEALKHEVSRIIAELTDGASLTGALKDSVYFPPSIIGVVAVGEAGGTLDQGLRKLADSYERDIQQKTKTLNSLMEPVLILIMGSVVGFIVMAMLLPIFQINMVFK